MYAWKVPDEFEREHVAHLLFVFDDGEAVEVREHAVPFRPFTFEQLRDRIRAAGLREVDSDFDPSSDRYSIVVRKEEPAQPGTQEGRSGAMRQRVVAILP